MSTVTHRIENWIFPRLPLIRKYYTSFARARLQLKVASADNEQFRENHEATFFLVNTLQDNCNALEWELKRVKAERDAALFVANITEVERNSMENDLKSVPKTESERLDALRAHEHRWIRIDLMPPNAAEIIRQENEAVRAKLDQEMSELPRKITEMKALSKHWSDEAYEAELKLKAYEAKKTDK